MRRDALQPARRNQSRDRRKGPGSPGTPRSRSGNARSRLCSRVSSTSAPVTASVRGRCKSREVAVAIDPRKLWWWRSRAPVPASAVSYFSRYESPPRYARRPVDRAGMRRNWRLWSRLRRSMRMTAVSWGCTVCLQRQGRIGSAIRLQFMVRWACMMLRQAPLAWKPGQAVARRGMRSPTT